ALGRDTHTPEPTEPDPDLGEDDGPARGAQVLGRIAERPAAHHPPLSVRRGFLRTVWICRQLCSIGSVPVPAPFPDITMHVVQSPEIRPFASDWLWTTRVVGKP